MPPEQRSLLPMPMNPRSSRGEIWLVDLGMVEKVRPALALSGGCVEEDRDLITVVPHTATLRASRFEIAVPLPSLKPGAFLAQSPATVPSPPGLKLLGRVRAEEPRRIEGALLAWRESKH